jgi:hypothetical protein
VGRYLGDHSKQKEPFSAMGDGGEQKAGVQETVVFGSLETEIFEG